jgi:hypothetical protein
MMEISTQIIYLLFSVGIGLWCYRLGFLDGAAAQRRQDREKESRWREFEDL